MRDFGYMGICFRYEVKPVFRSPPFVFLVGEGREGVDFRAHFSILRSVHCFSFGSVMQYFSHS